MYSTAKKSLGEQSYNCIAKWIYEAKAHSIKPYKPIQDSYWENIRPKPQTRQEDEIMYSLQPDLGYSKRDNPLSKYRTEAYRL